MLELVEGETLAERIASGAFPLDEALPIARQIAEALEAAHEKGIVHRDLKPANVKLTPEGKVKVLDFGLAKALTGDSSSPDATSSPTLTAAATRAGVVIGTAAYMSPEQARGKSVDRRGDVWAFGAVLYEMLAGRKAFEGETVSDTLAAVLTRDPDWNALPSGTPASVRRVLKRCLDRDPRTRLHDIADARLEMDESPEPVEAESRIPETRWKRAIPWVLSGVLALTAAAALLRPVSRNPAPVPTVIRVSRPLDGINVIGSTIGISPNGTRIAYSTWDETNQLRLMLWRTEESEPRAIAGPGLGGFALPFFSPDGEWLGVVGREKIAKFPISGGDFIDVAERPAEDAIGACWTSGGQIIFGRRTGGLMAVPAAGGELREITRAGAKGVGHRWPQALPGDRALLFTIGGAEKGPPRAVIVAISKGRVDGPIRELVADAEAAQFVPPDHLVFWRGTSFLAVPFDLSSLSVTGPALPALKGVSGAASWLAVSSTGTLVLRSPTDSERSSASRMGRSRRRRGPSRSAGSRLSRPEHLSGRPPDQLRREGREVSACLDLDAEVGSAGAIDVR